MSTQVIETNKLNVASQMKNTTKYKYTISNKIRLLQQADTLT